MEFTGGSHEIVIAGLENVISAGLFKTKIPGFEIPVKFG